MIYFKLCTTSEYVHIMKHIIDIAVLYLIFIVGPDDQDLRLDRGSQHNNHDNPASLA